MLHRLSFPWKGKTEPTTGAPSTVQIGWGYRGYDTPMQGRVTFPTRLKAPGRNLLPLFGGVDLIGRV
jgi:hypothetical protein